MLFSPPQKMKRSSGGRIHDHLNTDLGPSEAAWHNTKVTGWLARSSQYHFHVAWIPATVVQPTSCSSEREELSKTDPIRWALRCAVLLTFRLRPGKSASLRIQVTASSKAFSFIPVCVLCLPSFRSTIFAGLAKWRWIQIKRQIIVMRKGREKALKH